MSRDQQTPTRRTVLSRCGAFGAGLAGLAALSGTGTATRRHPDPTVQLRASADPIPFHEIEANRRSAIENRAEILPHSKRGKRSTMTGYPTENRDRIVAYNFDVQDGQTREYFGYADSQDDSPGTLSQAAVERVHERADDHAARSGTTTASDGEFDDWEYAHDVRSDHTSEDGNLVLDATCYRRHDQSRPTDVYGLVTNAEMGGGGLRNPDPNVENDGLTVTHNWWRSIADMDHDRHPTSMSHGQISEDVSLSISSGGISFGASYSYSQRDVRTYDESDPWSDNGEWRVEIDNDHTRYYTAELNPASLAEVERQHCLNLPDPLPSGVLVGTVSAEGVWKKSFDQYSELNGVSITDDCYRN